MRTDTSAILELVIYGHSAKSFPIIEAYKVADTVSKLLEKPTGSDGMSIIKEVGHLDNYYAYMGNGKNSLGKKLDALQMREDIDLVEVIDSFEDADSDEYMDSGEDTDSGKSQDEDEYMDTD